MIEIDLTSNLQEVLDRLKKASEHIDDLTPLTRDLAGILEDAVEENFEQQGRPQWQPLAESTIERREKKGYWPGKILQMTGRLASSIESSFDKNSARVFVGGKDFPYAAIHQFGGKAGRGHKVIIPARPYLSLAEDDMQEIQEAISRYLDTLPLV